MNIYKTHNKRKTAVGILRSAAEWLSQYMDYLQMSFVSCCMIKSDCSNNKLQCSRIDAFDMWALRKILRIPYTRHVTNVEVRATTGCYPLSHLVTDRCLRLFGHIARSSPQEDHRRAVAAVIRGYLLIGSNR